MIFSRTKKSQEKGFTLVELMVSTAVFSLVLLGAMAAIIQVTRLYYRGIHFAKTQEVARSTLEEITQSIQFTNEEITSPTKAMPTPPVIDKNNEHVGYFCVGSKMYYYALDRQLKSGGSNEAKKQKAHVLWVDDDDCIGAPPSVNEINNKLNNTNLSGGRELLSENMRITQLSIMPTTTTGLYTIKLAIAYGDDDLLEVSGDNTRRICQSSKFGVELCATSELSATVLKRL